MIFIVDKKTGAVIEKTTKSDAADFLSAYSMEKGVSVCHDYVVIEGVRCSIGIEVSIRTPVIDKNAPKPKEDVRPLVG